MNYGNTNKKWITISEYVDIDTGELISKKLQERDYVTLRKTKKYTENEKYRIITHTNECERNRQTRLW